MKTERKTVASEEKVPDDCIFLSFDQTQLEKTLEIKFNKLRESLEKKRAREKESQKRSEQLESEIENQKQENINDLARFKSVAFTYGFDGKLIPVRPLKLNEFRVPTMDVKLPGLSGDAPSSSRLSKTPGTASSRKRLQSASSHTVLNSNPSVPTQPSNNRADTNEARLETIESKDNKAPSKEEIVKSKPEENKTPDYLQEYKKTMKQNFKPTKGVTFKFGNKDEEVVKANWPGVYESENKKTGNKVKKMTRVHFEKVAHFQGSRFFSNLKRKYQTGVDIEDDLSIDSTPSEEEEEAKKKKKPHSSNLIRTESRSGTQVLNKNASDPQLNRLASNDLKQSLTSTYTNTIKEDDVNWDQLELEKDLGKVFEEGKFVEVSDKNRGTSIVLNTDKNILRSLLDKESSRSILRSARQMGSPFKGRSQSQTREETGFCSIAKMSTMIEPFKNSSNLFNQSVVSIHCNTRDGIKRETKERTGAIKPGVSPLRIRRTRISFQSQF